MTDQNQPPNSLFLPKDGSVAATALPKVSEKEIHDARELITHRLHAAYVNLGQNMAPFQEAWDSNPMTATADAMLDGLSDGVQAWGSDFSDMFTKSFWEEVGDKVGDAAGSVYDTAAYYATSFHDDLKDDVAKLSGMLDNPDDTLLNWRWWQAQVQQANRDMVEDSMARYNQVRQLYTGAVETLSEMAGTGQKLITHREAILGLPELIAAGDPKPIQAFVDTVLMDIDPDLALAIKSDPNFHVVLELLNDNDSALMYMAYVGLTLESIPPNFYAYVGGKGGVYVLIEVVLLVVMALLTAGTATAARISLLLTRLAVRGVGAARVTKKIAQTQAAFSAFVRSIEDFMVAADRLQDLGQKLTVARQRGLKLQGGAKTTLVARRQLIKRDKRCRVCGSTKHRTPGGRPGNVNYD